MPLTPDIRLSGTGPCTVPVVLFRINLRGGILTASSSKMIFTPVMARQGSGSALNLTSRCGLRPPTIATKAFTTFPAFYRPDAVTEEVVNTVRKTPRLFPPIQGSL